MENSKLHKLNNLKLKLLIKELNLLESEEEYVSEFTNHYRPLFMTEVHNTGEEIPIQTGDTRSETNKKEKKIEVSEEELQKIKNVFRSIAKLCHPDKTTDTYLIGMYDEAQKAYDRNDLLTLFKLTQKMSIEIDIDETNIYLMERIVSEKKQELKMIESSFLWLWANAKTDEEKQNLILQFVNQHKK
jgi:hypothetical protein